MASHGVEGEGVHSRWEAGHVTHLPFPVGSHGDGAPRGPQQATGLGGIAWNTWNSPENQEFVSFQRLSGCGDWMRNDGASGLLKEGRTPLQNNHPIHLSGAEKTEQYVISS